MAYPEDVQEHYFKCACGCGREGYAPEALPLAAAAHLEEIAVMFRELLHMIPEYTYGSLAWNVMNDIDHNIERLRNEPLPPKRREPAA